jgi:hypothetical protein
MEVLMGKKLAFPIATFDYRRVPISSMPVKNLDNSEVQ